MWVRVQLQSPKLICYRNYKSFNDTPFLQALNKTDFTFSSNNPDENYNILNSAFSRVINKHGPLKKKVSRKVFRKLYTSEVGLEPISQKIIPKIMSVLIKSKEIDMHPSEKIYISKNVSSNYFSNITNKGILNNEDFRKAIKPFLTNKCCLSNNGNVLVNKVDIITEENTLVKNFTNQCINIVEKCSGTKPIVLVNHHNNFQNIVNII